jgi:hypothetical protein
MFFEIVASKRLPKIVFNLCIHLFTSINHFVKSMVRSHVSSCF